MYLQPINNIKTVSNQQTSFGGYLMLPENIEKSISGRKNKAILKTLERKLKKEYGDVRIWNDFDVDGNRKCLFGAVDHWSGGFVERAASSWQGPNESILNFLKRMCRYAHSAKSPFKSDTKWRVTDFDKTLIVK